MINSAKKIEFFFFFLRRIRNIHSCQANCVTLARLFRFLPGLPVPRISFLSTVSRFLYKHAHTRAGGTMAPIGCSFFFKLFSINLLLLVFLFNVHVYIYVEIRKVISWYNNNNNLEQNFQVSQTFFRLINKFIYIFIPIVVSNNLKKKKFLKNLILIYNVIFVFSFILLSFHHIAIECNFVAVINHTIDNPAMGTIKSDNLELQVDV